MSHVWACHVTHMNASHHTFTYGISHDCDSHCANQAIRMDWSRHTYEWVISIYVNVYTQHLWKHGVATISRLLKIIGLFCKRALQKRPIFSKETYNFKEPTNRSHPIPEYVRTCTYDGGKGRESSRECTTWKVQSATHCNTLQYTACNTLQHTYTYIRRSCRKVPS